MQDFEKLENPKPLELIRLLREQRTLVNVVAPGGYEGLTVITDFEPGAELPVFAIDPPNGLREAIKEAPAGALGFEFTGNDRLKHQFEAQLLRDDGKHLHFSVPDHIRRYQLRSNFRIKAPRGAELLVTIEEHQVSMVIENVSMSGVFCYCSNSFRELVESYPRLENVQLVFTFQSQCTMVPVAQAQLRRLESEPHPKKFGVAYQFERIKPEAQRFLRQQIYEMQREYLQHRLKLVE
jgi:hypothetical protein